MSVAAVASNSAKGGMQRVGRFELRSVLGRMQLSSTAAALLAKELPVLSAPV